jgi:hypothetical protein
MVHMSSRSTGENPGKSSDTRWQDTTRGLLFISAFSNAGLSKKQLDPTPKTLARPEFPPISLSLSLSLPPSLPPSHPSYSLPSPVKSGKKFGSARPVRLTHSRGAQLASDRGWEQCPWSAVLSLSFSLSVSGSTALSLALLFPPSSLEARRAAVTRGRLRLCASLPGASFFAR